ncbi:MAG: rhodanese-like domain-containing protein [Proteobacteria bacterium]|nr:rhodanese-like domain-containing protein [Pseudomonadota bacterium]
MNADFLIGAGLIVAMLAPGPASATHDDAFGPFGNAACYVFGGRENCRTVRIFDAEECIIKVHPRPLPDLEPGAAACLLDEVRTKMVYLRKARPGNMAVADRVSIKGGGVVEVLVRYDDIGAAVWETKNADSFDLKGDPALTRKAIESFSSRFCAGQSRMVGGGTSGGIIGAKEAFRRAAEGSIVLVDIRLPSEWRQTGIGVNAKAITMHQSVYKFVDQLKLAAGPEKRPIALICAEGVRSSAMQRTLRQYGFKGVIDVHEGMIGGKAGPGWIKSGLPVTSYNPEQAQVKP